MASGAPLSSLLAKRSQCVRFSPRGNPKVQLIAMNGASYQGAVAAVLRASA
jgi:hypothetical protein